MERCGLGMQFKSHMYTLRSVGECEGMNPHTPNWSHFESWSPNGFSNFQRVVKGVKNHWIEEFII
jgi:hypothetical protein